MNGELAGSVQNSCK